MQSAFIGRAIERRSNAAMNAAQDIQRVGYVVLRLDPSLLDSVLADRSNLGSTGETFAVGPDGMLRSDPPSAVARAGEPAARTGLETLPTAGVDGKIPFVQNGAEHLALASDFQVFGKPWKLIATQASEEAFAAVHQTTNTMLMTILAVLGGTLVVGIFAARAITTPLDRLTRALRGSRRAKPRPRSPACVAATRSARSPARSFRSAR